MYFRYLLTAVGMVLMFTCGGGCEKPVSSGLKSTPTVLPPDTVASLHWVGKRHLDLEADAYYFCRVWSLPETTQLESQALDHFSTDIWRLLLGNPAGSQIPAAVLRPLLQELTFAETYLEIRAVTNACPLVVLAVRVNPRDAGMWETNTAIAAELLAKAPAVARPDIHGWTLHGTNSPVLVTLTRIGGWSILSTGSSENSLAEDVVSRIKRNGVPFVSAGTNLWLETTLDPARLAVVFPSIFSGFKSPVSNIESLRLTLSGDGADVITHADLKLVKPVGESLAPWQLPLPLLHEPLASFAAARGIQPLLKNLDWWNSLPGEMPPPDQLFMWSLSGSPYQVYLAASLPDARQRVATLSDVLIQKGNPWLAAHGYISFDRASDSNGVTWGNLPDIRPFIKFAGGNSDGWLYGGLFPDQRTNTLLPSSGMVQDILCRTNLVYYNWETTGPRLAPCLQLGQTIRLVARRPQMPTDSVGLNWLKVLVPRLRDSTTRISRIGPSELTLYRRSTLGLTAPELHLLADWLESPQFPYGLHTTAR